MPHCLKTSRTNERLSSLDLTFLAFFTFLHHGIEKVGSNHVWKPRKNIQKESWSNLPPMLGACIGFLHKVAHKFGRLGRFHRARGNEFSLKSATAWNCLMKLCTLAHHAHGYKVYYIFLNFNSGAKLWSFKVEKTAKIFNKTLKNHNKILEQKIKYCK